MSTIQTTLLSLALLCMFATSVFGTNDRGDRGGRRTPPPEAYTACEGKSAGDKAEFESPRGDTVTGICVATEDGKLVLHPDHPPRRQ